MNNEFIFEVNSIIVKLKGENHTYLDIPYVIQKLELFANYMQKNQLSDADLIKASWEIERYLSDDKVFCDTEIGEQIYNVHNSIINEAKLNIQNEKHPKHM